MDLKNLSNQKLDSSLKSHTSTKYFSVDWPSHVPMFMSRSQRYFAGIMQHSGLIVYIHSLGQSITLPKKESGTYQTFSFKGLGGGGGVPGSRHIWLYM